MSYYTKGMGAYEVPEETASAAPSLTQQVTSGVQNVAAGVVSNPALLILPVVIAGGLYYGFLGKRKPLSRMLGLAKEKK